MPMITIIVLVVFVLWTRDVFFPAPPKSKTPEEAFGEAIAKYLKEGVKTRQ